jgi:superfamily II DNA or RNA helicase
MGCVIATRVWSEGINIKSVDVVINAVGGNSELAAIQRFGRGMRITEDKNEVILVDLIDSNSHKWFERHSMERICFYSERGWL